MWNRAALGTALLLLAAGAVMFWRLDALPYLDLPNHVARACAIAGVVQGDPFYTANFVFRWDFYPYLAGDLLLAAGCAVLPPVETGRMAMALGYLLFPLSLLAYHRAAGGGPRTGLLLLLGAYLGTNWYFLQGFFAFHIGVAATFLTLAALEKRLAPRAPGESGLRWTLLYTAGCVACYLLHLASFVFLLALAALALLRRVIATRRLEALVLVLLAPLAILTLYQGIQSILVPFDLSTGGAVWRPLLQKLPAIGTAFVRFSTALDAALFLLFLAACALLVMLRPFALHRLLPEAGVLFALFLAMPVGMGSTYHLDERALPYLLAMLALLACASPGVSPRAEQLAVAAAILLGAANLVYLYRGFAAQNARAREVLAVYRELPEGKRVFPVATIPNAGRMQPFPNLGNLYIPLRRGLAGYVQGADNNNPMRHFAYRQRPYAPDYFWYTRRTLECDWSRVLRDYDYVVVTKPYDRARLAPELALVRSAPGADVYAAPPRP